MGKNIIDYLHLYIGCKMMTDFCGHKSVKTLSAIVGNTAIYNCDDVDDVNMSASWDMSNQSEPDLPILRPLSDMTEEEGKEIIGLIYQSIFQDIPAISTIEKLTEDDKVGFIAFEKELNLRLSVTAEVDRGVEFYENGSQMKVRQFDVTAWLLSKHFDIFGLIEAGLAIDATEEAVS